MKLDIQAGEKDINQKILRILHNLIDSDSLDSLLEKKKTGHIIIFERLSKNKL